MPEPMPLHTATAILRGRDNPSAGDLLTAGQRISAELTRLYRIEIWANRLINAHDPTTTERALRGLTHALTGYPTDTQ